MAKAARRQPEGRHRYLENICGAEQLQMCTIEDEFNIDGSMEV